VLQISHFCHAPLFPSRVPTFFKTLASAPLFSAWKVGLGGRGISFDAFPKILYSDTRQFHEVNLPAMGNDKSIKLIRVKCPTCKLNLLTEPSVKFGPAFRGPLRKREKV
jgi:hypothetical protein